jgi:uncharacterized protein (TIGR03083 family)
VERNPGAPPIQTAHLFKELDGLLLDLLRSLEPADWSRPTVSPAWSVKQVAAHLLDTALRRLAFARDGCLPPASEARSDRELVNFVNELNAQGVTVFGRLSPEVLISLMEVAVAQLSQYLESLNPFDRSLFPVSWAGERESANWFDVAREFTERWHHQQQIRLAVGRTAILTPRLYGPVLECFMRGLPHAYRNAPARTGSVVRVSVEGESGGTWLLTRLEAGWKLTTDINSENVLSTVRIPEEIAWRVFTKGISRPDALRQTRIEGDQDIGRVALTMVSIVG